MSHGDAGAAQHHNKSYQEAMHQQMLDNQHKAQVQYRQQLLMQRNAQLHMQSHGQNGDQSQQTQHSASAKYQSFRA